MPVMECVASSTVTALTGAAVHAASKRAARVRSESGACMASAPAGSALRRVYDSPSLPVMAN
jgi:hypothetical protein